MPGLHFPVRYDEVRDRRKAGWLGDEMCGFLHQTLGENNRKYHFLKKKAVNENNRRAALAAWYSPSDYSEKIMMEMKNDPSRDNYTLVQARHNARLMYGRNIPPEIRWIYNLYKPQEKDAVLRQKDAILRGERYPIRVTTEEKCSGLVEGNEIWIVGALVDGTFYDAADIFEEAWMRRMRMVGWRSYDNSFTDHSVIGYLPKGRETALVLEKNRWRGICTICCQGRNLEVDTYGDCDDGVLSVCLLS